MFTRIKHKIHSKGHFTVIKKCLNKKNKKEYAVKIINKQRLKKTMLKAITSSIIDKYSFEGLEYYAEVLCSVALDREVYQNYKFSS